MSSRWLAGENRRNMPGPGLYKDQPRRADQPDRTDGSTVRKKSWMPPGKRTRHDRRGYQIGCAIPTPEWNSDCLSRDQADPMADDRLSDALCGF